MQKTTKDRCNYYGFCLAALTMLFFVQMVVAQKAMPERTFEISLEADEKIETEIRANGRFNVNTGKPIALYGLDFSVPQGTPESMAMFYIENEAKKLGIPTHEIANLRYHATRSTDAGHVVRYRQYSGNYPVNRNEVTITISPENKVVYVMNSYESNIDMANVQPRISANDAYSAAINYLNVQSDISYSNTNLLVYKNTKIKKLAHEVVISATEPLGEWHVFVDALNGEIFKVVDMNHYYHDYDNNDSDNVEVIYPMPREYYRRVDGSGFVFDPDPLTSNAVAYGGQYVDGNDATNAALDAARFNVTLRDITQNGSTYSLVGPRAEIIDFDSPSTGLFTQSSSVFEFNRQDQGFEPVNVYYHIDYLMGYINDDLGCNVLPYQYNGGVQYDPHGAGGADNSYYTGGAGRLAFGEGCVDDAEDSDVIHHELGHGLHDWVTSGGLSQVDGLSEGCGDYVAQSYNRGVNIANGYWTSADPAWNYVFNWDGHNTCWPGRTTGYGAVYPGGLVGQIHTDGQIWASCLMTVWDEIGQERMDKIFYEGLGMTNGSTNQNDAANAVYQAALNLSYTDVEIQAIHSGLTACGYTLPPLDGPPIIAFSADMEILCLDSGNTVSFTDESAPAGTSWLWTFEGGTPGTSTDQNPVVTYATEGVYDVTLEATNSHGTSSLTLTDYITVVSGDACPSCISYDSAPNLGLSIPDGVGSNSPGSPLTHTITVPMGDDTVIDFVTVNTDIAHTYINDLEITITHPDGTTAVVVWDRNCANENNIDVTFEDGADAIACAEPTVGTYNPANPLSAFSGLNSAGDWTISIRDFWSADLGTLNDWSIYICGEAGLSVDEFAVDGFALYPNPNNGQFTISLNSSNPEINLSVYDIQGRSVLNNSFQNTGAFNQVINLENAQSGMYLVKVTDGDKQTIKKILIE
ncbi:T9SS type A sorting domain-containing protein [Hanstruepera flava]|uniref:T9SS type A sorting domain-containing protein n=1 Tax=Hanstruepera flava TaxID=2930218 RepID=UPI0020294B59|nr:T9SS type A sorting domain-containing protein [Hanstruepera flava]